MGTLYKNKTLTQQWQRGILLRSTFFVGIALCTLAEGRSQIRTKNRTERDYGELLLETLKKDVQNPLYAKTTLPHDFSSLIGLLQYGKDGCKPHEYTRSVIRLFTNQIKAADYVNPRAFVTLLESLADLIRPHAIQSHLAAGESEILTADATSYFSKAINKLMYNTIFDEYDFFRNEPDQFLEKLAHHIADMSEERLLIDRLREGVIRFLEVGLGKIIWSPADGVQTWHSVKTIAQSLQALHDHHIIEDTNDLDDLYWTLVHRYCFFLQLSRSFIAPEVYAHIKQEIEIATIPLLVMEEQDYFIEPKKNVLLRAIATTTAAAQKPTSTEKT